MQQDEMNKLVDAIREVLPTAAINEVVGRALSNALQSLTWNNNSIETLVRQAITERAMELLSTTYKIELDKQANLLAANLVRDFQRLRWDSR
jgi:hypothetical protein